MKELVEKLKNAKKKRMLFGERKLYRRISDIAQSDLLLIELKYNLLIPDSIKFCLVELGSCCIAEQLNFHSPFEIYPLDNNGSVEGYVVFASDTSGNYFAFNPASDNETIYFLCHDPLGYAAIADSIGQFLEIFINNDFKFDGLFDNFDFIDI